MCVRRYINFVSVRGYNHIMAVIRYRHIMGMVWYRKIVRMLCDLAQGSVLYRGAAKYLLRESFQGETRPLRGVLLRRRMGEVKLAASG